MRVKLKKIISPVDCFIKDIIVFIFIIFVLLISVSFVSANENTVHIVNSTGRALIINDNVSQAKKRALDDALYLASLQGGAKVDGFSSIDSKTSLKENLIVRPSSEIIDFRILEEKNDKTHFIIKIEAALYNKDINLNCSQKKLINISLLKPHFIISSKLPAWTQLLPQKINDEILNNLKLMDDINISDKTSFFINPDNMNNLDRSLDYISLTEKKLTIKNGEFSIIPIIILDFHQSRIHRFSREVSFNIQLKIYEGPNFKFIENINYNFSLNLGNRTGYTHIDTFYKVPLDKFRNYMNMSLSKIHYRVIDNIKCLPLETKLVLQNQMLIAPLGTNQGLHSGKIGIISNSNTDHSNKDWTVLSVKSSSADYSVIETLNPNVDLRSMSGKIIRFMD